MIADLNYDLRVSPRARNVTLKVNRANGLVVVVPRDFDRNLLPDILNSRQGWIDQQLERFEGLPGRFELNWPPEQISIDAGRQHVAISYSQTDNARLLLKECGDSLHIDLPSCYDDEDLAALFVRWFKKHATRHFTTLAASLSAKTGLYYERIAVRGQKTRWGSFSSRGTLSLNYKLLFLPRELLEHVILHELSHSIHMNHSQAFWSLLESVDPHCKKHDKQLADGWKYLPTWLD